MSTENTKAKVELEVIDEKKEKKEIILINEETIQNKIYMVRGQKVMLDVDLAEIYGYETKNFNRQVKNNQAKFEGDDFMFQLTNEELSELLRCKNCTLNRGAGQGKHVKYNPYVFTEQGIYMLMTVLRGELATKQSRALIRTFKQMKDYIVENQGLLNQRDFLQLTLVTAEHTRDIREIKSSLNRIDNEVASLNFAMNMSSGMANHSRQIWHIQLFIRAQKKRCM